MSATLSSPGSGGALSVGNAAPVLRASGVTAGYGSEPVVHDINLEVYPGEVVALLGANGAGKTTTLLALSGELPIMAGEIRLHDAPTSAPLYQRARAGLGFLTEEKSVFMGLTTRQNFRVAEVDLDRAMTLFPELEKRIDLKGGQLSGGEQQMLSVARALGRNPKVLLADELSLGLAPLVVKRLLEAVRAAADQGTGVLLVEQHVQQALRYADRAVVLQRGRIAFEGTAVEMRSRINEIEASYLASRAQDTSDHSVDVDEEAR